MSIKGKDGQILSRSEGEAIMKGRGAITISIFALLLAIFQMVSNGNSGKVLTTTLEITDTWSFYQSKSIKQSLAEYAYDDAVRANDTKRASEIKAKIDRYESEPSTGEGKKEISAKARKLEAERAEAKKRSPYYSMAISLLQIGLVLSSTAILAVSMEFLWASVIAATLACGLFANGFWLIFL
jgi:type IV secretory pathway VirB6-like protein